MGGMSVGRWLSFGDGVCLCVIWVESSFVSILVGDSVHRALAQHLLSVDTSAGNKGFTFSV